MDGRCQICAIVSDELLPRSAFSVVCRFVFVIRRVRGRSRVYGGVLFWLRITVSKMNAEVATDSLNVLNRHMAHMAESVIHSSTTSTTPTSKSVDDCVSFYYYFFFFFLLVVAVVVFVFKVSLFRLSS